MPRFTLYLHIACAFMTVWYAAQTLIIAQRYAPLAALWGSTRGGCMGPGIRFDFCAVCDSLVFCVGVFAVMTSIIRMVCMIVALQHSDDTVYYVSVAMVWSTIEFSAVILLFPFRCCKHCSGYSRTSVRRCITMTQIIWGQLVLGRFLGPQRGNIFDGYDVHETIFDVDWGQIGARRFGALIMGRLHLRIRFASMLGDARPG